MSSDGQDWPWVDAPRPWLCCPVKTRPPSSVALTSGLFNSYSLSTAIVPHRVNVVLDLEWRASRKILDRSVSSTSLHPTLVTAKTTHQRLFLPLDFDSALGSYHSSTVPENDTPEEDPASLSSHAGETDWTGRSSEELPQVNNGSHELTWRGISLAGTAQMLDMCKSSHGLGCSHVDRRVNLQLRKSKLLLVDVERLCLDISSGRSPPYLALSYVWGGVDQLRTTKEDLDYLQTPGALIAFFNELSQVVKDAIEVTGLLGFRYLWIDTLCIVQDDAESKHRRLRQMASIFNAASATIIALSGRDASEPLNSPFQRPGDLAIRRWTSRMYASSHDQESLSYPRASTQDHGRFRKGCSPEGASTFTARQSPRSLFVEKDS